MIVPDHWAEARRQHRAAGKQVTVRRFGWSTTSEADACAQAEARAEAALQRILAGEKLIRREPKVAYNGATGMPIREEVLARHGEQVITRNAYGAQCLNSPNALFADIDFNHTPPAKTMLLVFAALALASLAFGWWMGNWGPALLALLVAVVATASLSKLLHRLVEAARGGSQHHARKLLVRFVTRHPSWNLRLYRTPAGYRVLATHQPFEADADEVQQFFAAVSADPVYVRMCINQRCFRARLTAKPWRIGLSTHMRPRPGVWPVQPEHLEIRTAWVKRYESLASAYAACRYVESLGSGVIHAAIQPVVTLHDKACRAHEAEAKLA